MTDQSDLIVVGAGTAGCVLAERLTAGGRRKVLLLEAGGEPCPDSRVPALFQGLFKSRCDWAFESEPQAGAAGRRVFVPRGRMLGGSSNLNAQIHQWGHPADFAGWVAAGATGWSWEDVAPVYRSQERWSGGDGYAERGRDGPMRVASNRNALSLSRAFVAAARAAGVGQAMTHNGGAFEGAWLTELAQHRGRRFSVDDAYLRPAMRRSNLSVVSGAQVVRIRFDGRRAIGVVARVDGLERNYDAGGVVLAAGAFGSPQLLMLSGVGDGAALAEFGLPVVHDVPEVGANLQDHPMATLLFRTRGEETMLRASSLSNRLRYALFRSGMRASNGVEAFAFTRALATPGEPPDLELLFAPVEWRNQALDPPRHHAFSLGVIAAAPRSRGRVTLASADPLAAPRVDFGLLTDREGHDAAVLAAGLRRAREIAATAPLAAEIAKEAFPGPAVATEAELLAAVRPHMQTVYHPAGTCRMGSDAHAVVDPRLAVRGLDRFWIADASVMPALTRAHPNATVAVIAERAAGWIDAAYAG